jgi:hypothetical protein
VNQSGMQCRKIGRSFPDRKTDHCNEELPFIQKLQRGLVIESIRAVLSLSGSLNNVPRHYCYDLNQGTLIALSMDKVPLPFRTNITAIATSATMELHMPKS